MAHLYQRGRQYWISYYVSGDLVQRSLRTTDERIARAKKKRLEYDLALGDLHVASKTPLSVILEAFCQELKTTRTFKSYKNDFCCRKDSNWPSLNDSEAGAGEVLIEAFINGPRPVASKPFPVNPKADSSKLAIGQERDAINHPGRESFDGELARLLVYERPLTHDELAQTITHLKTSYGIP